MTCVSRALVYVEGNAHLRKTEAGDGNTQQNLSITQGTFGDLLAPLDGHAMSLACTDDLWAPLVSYRLLSNAPVKEGAEEAQAE